jgi:glycosyltransferase involved in cell wall biosynthesis
MLDPWALKRSAWKKRMVRFWFEDAHLRGAACLRATSALEASHFRTFGLRNPIAIVANGIDLPTLRLKPAKPGPHRRVLFLSRIHPKKGIDLLLRCWSSLERSHDDWELIIAGPDEGGHAADMKMLAEELFLKRVRWAGPVYGDEKSALYRAADLFVLPTHAENFGLVVGEALAHEVPVITTTGAPWDELEANGCGWWIELSERVLASALDEAMRLSDETRREMGARGRAWVEQAFAWPAIARQMAEVYEWVAGGGAPPATVSLD